jgi:hypothetical protein
LTSEGLSDKVGVMKIETAFSVGDKVFFLNDGAIYHRVITRIMVETVGDKASYATQYFFENCDCSGNLPIIYKYEEEVAATKHELVEKLPVMK